MHEDIVNLAEESRSCTRYGKNAKYLIPKNASKPLPLLTQPGQKNTVRLIGTDRKSKWKNLLAGSYRLILQIEKKSTSRKRTVKCLRTHIVTHGFLESIRSDQFSSFKGKHLENFALKITYNKRVAD